MPFFVMECPGETPARVIDDYTDLGEPPWMHGGMVDKPEAELVYTLDPSRPGKLKAIYSGPEYPIMRDDMVEALKAAGVDNLQLFDALVLDPESGVKHTNYKAFNVLGLVAAADLARSTVADTSESELIDVDFDSLAIDSTKAGPFKFFRLAESVDAMIVSDEVRAIVEARSIPGLVFYEPSDWAG